MISENSGVGLEPLPPPSHTSITHRSTKKPTGQIESRVRLLVKATPFLFLLSLLLFFAAQGQSLFYFILRRGLWTLVTSNWQSLWPLLKVGQLCVCMEFIFELLCICEFQILYNLCQHSFIENWGKPCHAISIANEFSLKCVKCPCVPRNCLKCVKCPSVPVCDESVVLKPSFGVQDFCSSLHWITSK